MCEFQIQKRISSLLLTYQSAVIFVFVGTLVGTGLRFLYRMIIGRYLGPFLLGLFLIGLGLFRISGRIACLGIQNDVLMYVTLYFGEKDEKRIRKAIILGLTIFKNDIHSHLLYFKDIMVGLLVYISGFFRISPILLRLHTGFLDYFSGQIESLL